MSSDNYAGRLSEYPNKGICGLPESVDTKRSLDNKISKLVKLLKESQHVVVMTGAGVSTSAGIPDFRGPNGIWTQEMEKDQQKKKNIRKRGKGRKRKLNSSSSSSQVRAEEEGLEVRVLESETKPESKPQASFETAKPTLTHRAITSLSKEQFQSSSSTSTRPFTSRAIVQYVITQNVDGLHMRSGLSRSKHCFLHGCIFTEKCEKCGMEYFRDFDIGGVSFQKTGRTCTKRINVASKNKTKKPDVGIIKVDCDDDGNSNGDEDKDRYEVCGGDLRDTILDWEDELPEEDWETAQIECENSDLVLALGTSLRIEPAGSLPTLGEKFVIVNKQVTPYDSRAEMIIRAPVDEVFRRVMEELRGPDWDQDEN